jgi:hypothetical protein
MPERSAAQEGCDEDQGGSLLGLADAGGARLSDQYCHAYGSIDGLWISSMKEAEGAPMSKLKEA